MKIEKLILSARSNAKLLTGVGAGLDGILITFQLSRCFLLLPVEDFRYFFPRQSSPEPGLPPSPSLSAFGGRIVLLHPARPPSTVSDNHPLICLRIIDSFIYFRRESVDELSRSLSSLQISSASSLCLSFSLSPLLLGSGPFKG